MLLLLCILSTVAACAFRNITSVDLAPGGSYGLWQTGKCMYIPPDETPACRGVPGPSYGPFVEFMIEPAPSDRTLAVTSCRMKMDPYIAQDVRST